MKKYLVVLALAVALSVSGAIGIAARTPAPALQAAPTAVVGVNAHQDLAGVITSLQATLRRVPKDDASWATLGLAYVEQARITGNPTYYGKADRAVATSFRLRPRGNVAALAAGAAVEAARHHFADALDLADRALRIDPRSLGALSIRVDALTELGRYGDQLRALRTADSRQPGVPIAARYSYAYELRGNLRRASSILGQAVQAGSRSDRAYLLTLMADIDRRQGRLGAAERHLGLALRNLPGYLPAMVSSARLDTARGHLRAAAREWQAVVARLALPEYLTELGELYAHLGRPGLARQQYAVVGSTTALLASNGVNTDLEAALFAADHGDPRQALVAARAEWGRRKSINVADVLGWALHRTGNDRQALVLARQATRLGTLEARPWIHRGTIEAALGMHARARADLRRGLAIDPGLSPWQADQARAVLAGLEGTR